MNYIKYQCDLIKLYDKDKLVSYKWDYVDVDRKELIMTYDGFVACIIPVESFYLSDIFKCASAHWTKFHQMLDISSGYSEADEINVKVEGKKTLFKLTANDRFAWIDSSKLKYFDQKNISFKIKDVKSPVMVCEWGYLVGFVMPVVRNMEGK